MNSLVGKESVNCGFVFSDETALWVRLPSRKAGCGIRVMCATTRAQPKGRFEERLPIEANASRKGVQDVDTVDFA